MKREEKIIKSMMEGKTFVYGPHTPSVRDKFTIGYKNKEWYFKINNIGKKFALTKKWVLAIIRLNTQGKLK
jgi:hypothetical protein